MSTTSREAVPGRRAPSQTCQGPRGDRTDGQSRSTDTGRASGAHYRAPRTVHPGRERGGGPEGRRSGSRVCGGWTEGKVVSGIWRREKVDFVRRKGVQGGGRWRWRPDVQSPALWKAWQSRAPALAPAPPSARPGTPGPSVMHLTPAEVSSCSPGRGQLPQTEWQIVRSQG